MIQTFFDFPVYFKFFIGLFALVNPVGIIPVFISMTSYQTAAARNKTNLTANLSVAIILWISLFLGDTILQLFGISIDSFRIAGGILVVTIAMSMISGKLGEDKQNKQEKSETAVRESTARGNRMHRSNEFIRATAFGKKAACPRVKRLLNQRRTVVNGEHNRRHTFRQLA